MCGCSIHNLSITIEYLGMFVLVIILFEYVDGFVCNIISATKNLI